MLLERVDRPVLEAVEHLVALQAQEQYDPYVALWSRVEGFDPHGLGGLIESRAVARGSLLRATIHLASARDFLELRALTEPAIARMFHTAFGRRLSVDLAELTAYVRELLTEQPRTRAELRPLLVERWPDQPTDSLTAIAYLLPVVQVPPRAVWGRGGQARWAAAEAWLGRGAVTDPSPDALVPRYLAAFGPATVMDMQNWAGLTKLRESFERLRPRLRVTRDEDGRELFDVPDAPLPDPDTPAPVRFLPLYDNVALGHKDRSRIVPPEAAALFADEGAFWSAVLIDGFVRGSWRLEDGAMRLRFADDVTAAERDEAEAEGERLRAFLSSVTSPPPSAS
jgi:hypothetical protein